MAKAKVVKAKKRCCTSRPRCKRCPVVCKRLVEAGLATERKGGRFELHADVRKKALKAARAR
jgi:aldehyde:ferredoxin oxidoreductase